MIMNEDKWEGVECSFVHCNHHGFISSPGAPRCVLGSPCRVMFVSRAGGKMSRWSPVRCGPHSNGREKASMEFHQRKMLWENQTS